MNTGAINVVEGFIYTYWHYIKVGQTKTCPNYVKNERGDTT